MRQMIVTVGMFGLLASACADDDKASSIDRPPTSSSALRGIDGLRYAVSSGDAATVATAVLSAQAYTLTIPTPRVAPLPDELPHAHTRPELSSFTGSASCTNTSCTFTNYGDAYNGASFRLNGTISVTADHLVFDLTLDFTSPSATLHWASAGDIVFTADHIDGWMTSNGTATDAEGTASWDFDVDHDNIAITAEGCPVSGSTTITYTFTSTDTPSSSGSLSLTYGPTCGDVAWITTN